jgi:hypothetical protein
MNNKTPDSDLFAVYAAINASLGTVAESNPVTLRLPRLR